MTPEEEANQDQRVKASYDKSCVNCGQVPTVDDSKLCGPCFFGEADCINPDNW